MSIKKAVLIFGFLLVFLVSGFDLYVSVTTSSRIFQNLNKLPSTNIALLLGTSRMFKGQMNQFYVDRIDAAVALFKSGKVRGILVSGDNRHKSYNEPADMRNDLIKKGVPSKYVTLDFAGFRTLDSVVRAKKVFEQQEIIIISQKFHCQRAVYLADAYGLKSYGFYQDHIDFFPWIKVRIREVFARFKAFLDLYMFGTQPRFLGKKETVALKDLSS